MLQVIHGRRTMYNVRNGWDIARFLGDAVEEDVRMHLANLQCALAFTPRKLHLHVCMCW
jgi:hypothetical protein